MRLSGPGVAAETRPGAPTRRGASGRPGGPPRASGRARRGWAREAEGGGGRRREAAGRNGPARPVQKTAAAAATRTAGGRDVSSARGAVPRVRVRREHAQKLLPDRGALEVGAPARRRAIGTFGRWPVAGVPSPQHPLVPPTHS